MEPQGIQLDDTNTLDLIRALYERQFRYKAKADL